MSSRAIRVLRGDAAGIILSAAANNESDDDDDDESEEEEARTYRPTAFAILNDDGEDSDDDDDDEKSLSSDERGKSDSSLAVALDSLAAGNPRKEAPTNGEGDHLTEMIARDEDFDAILSEFHANDTSLKMINDSTRPDNSLASPFTKLLESLDARDFDYNLSMRNSMLHNRETASSLMRNKKNPLFGPPVDGWGKPPRFVGGGIGMVNYNDVEEGDASSHVIPWPYSSSAEKVDISTEQQHWCTFTHSNSFQRDLQDYAVIQESGDLDALVMFVAHHPYVTAALLQLSNVCYQTNHNPEGLSFLRRCLWVFESSALASFQARILQSKVVLMDMTKPENAEFFQGLFRLIQISHITGLCRTAFSVSRLLLSLDPLRDPMHILLSLDCHGMGVVCGAVPSEQILILQWLINIVDSDVIQICYREKDDSHFCNVLNLPNWAFSYALASFLLLRTVGTNDDETDAELLKDKAGMSLQDALGRFPSFVGLLLRSLNINTTGRSLRRDWVSLLDAVSIRSNQLLRTWRETSQDSFVLASTLQTCDQIIKIYVKQIAKFWADDDILQWLFDNLSVVAMRTETDATPWPPPPSAAILRYANVNPLDYDDKIQTMPPDANIMNPGLLEHALNVQTNRPRFLRRQMRDEGRNFDMHGNIAGAHGNALNQRAFLGPPTHNVDPDWPMLEVFWRSFLPWNHVDGIPPPRR